MRRNKYLRKYVSRYNLQNGDGTESWFQVSLKAAGLLLLLACWYAIAVMLSA